MAGEAKTKPRELKLFQTQLGILVNDADFCLEAAREKYDEDQLYMRLVPVSQALVWDATEVVDEHGISIASFAQERLEELGLPSLILQLKGALAHFEQILEDLSLDSPAEEILISVCSVTGEVRRGIVELEQRTSRLYSVPPSQSLASELDRGLKLRRLYVRFERAVRGLSDRDDRVALAARLIENLFKNEAWAHARPLDCLRMDRLRAGLTDGDSDWDSITMFARSLRQIRRRVEICDHDLKLIETKLDEVRAHSVATKIDERFLTSIEQLRYLSDELDEVFQRGTSTTYGEWKYQLEMASDVIADAPNREVNRTTSEFPLPDQTF